MSTKFPKGSQIVDIRPGKGERAHILYAKIVDARGVLLVNATLEYCTNRLLDAGIEE